MLNLTGHGYAHYDPKKYKFASVYTIVSEGKDEIFEAVMQLVKHISYSKNKIWNRVKRALEVYKIMYLTLRQGKILQ